MARLTRPSVLVVLPVLHLAPAAAALRQLLCNQTERLWLQALCTIHFGRVTLQYLDTTRMVLWTVPLAQMVKYIPTFAICKFHTMIMRARFFYSLTEKLWLQVIPITTQMWLTSLWRDIIPM